MTREERLLSYMEERRVDAFFVSKPENVRYISGYTGDDSYLLFIKGKKYFITDPRYMEQAAAECPDYELFNWRTPGAVIGDAVGMIAEKEGAASVAFESKAVTFSDFQLLEDTVKAELVPVQNVIENFRAVKSSEEIEYLRISCEIASRAFERILRDIRIGVTEKEMASLLSHYMVLEGADTKPYGGILITGARTSLLHGIPSNKALEYGDFILMDYGCQYKGYLSDMTRTVVVGKATAKQREVYQLEQKMVADVEAVLKPGVTGVECYEASLKAIKGTEYEPYNYGGIGHGIGMFVHEHPFIGKNSDAVLEAGNVMTVEPGIYIPGWGGVRIEDQLLITENGYVNFISASKELIEL